MQFKPTFLATVLCATLGLAACGGGNSNGSAPAGNASGAQAQQSSGAAAVGEGAKVGATIYKYDDNFMSLMRKALEAEAATQKTAELLLNDSQNSQSTQNDQVDE